MSDKEHKDIICKNCKNVVFIDAGDMQKRLNDILADIQHGTDYKVNTFDVLTLLDDCIECCKKPDYWEVE